MAGFFSVIQYEDAFPVHQSEQFPVHSQLSEQIIQHRQSDYQKQPNTQQEDRENKRNFERRHPRLRRSIFPSSRRWTP